VSKTALVTGAAGFIGSHTAQALLARGDTVVGLDNLNDYYDPARSDPTWKGCNVLRMIHHASCSLRVTCVTGL
jgi:nucleoside-diphosphate-sugar epimerase